MPIVGPITSNWTTTSTTHAAVTGLNFPVSIGRVYHFEAFLIAGTGTTTIGVGFSVSTPGSDTILGWTVETPSSTTAITVLNSSSDSPDPGNSANVATTGANLVRVTGVVKPTVAGEVQIMAETESGTLTVYGGSYLRYRDCGATS